MKTIGLIYIEEYSDWTSCNSILANIIESYQLTGYQIVPLPLGDANDTSITDTILNSKISHLAFIDHRLPPGLILTKILKHSSTPLPLILVHIYGDFVLNCPKWKGAEEVFKKFKTHFICASTPQAEVVKKLIDPSFVSVSTIPFPVDGIFKFSKQNRENARSVFKLNPQDFVLCYTGRISLQKNVLNLLLTFKTLAETLPDLKLFIAGPFDDIGIPYLGLSRLPLTMETEFYLLIESFPQDIQNRINYVGNLNKEELLNLYHASDMYVSLSTHNDEDFGMSPAEAICSGLPLFLTSWGGFKDFQMNCPESVRSTDVIINEHQLKPANSTKNKLLKAIFNFLKADSSVISTETLSHYSTEAIAVQYKQILDNDIYSFLKFDLFFEEILKALPLKAPFANHEMSFSSTYFKLYQSYFEDKH